VKVLLNETGHALEFRRTVSGVREGVRCWQHVGVYAYRRDALFQWVTAPPVAEEQAERLEQLRPLALGMPIGVTTLDEEALPGIDTEADVQFAQEYLSSAPVAGIGNDLGEGFE
jgi:3-deoxy-manno-octulosonate cytidylyltransferase (CMP-KDO synthetase)